MKEYFSRRNKVILTEGGVLKTFSRKEDFLREKLMLTALRGCKVPAVLQEGKSSLLLSVIDGETLLHYTERAESENDTGGFILAAAGVFDIFDAVEKAGYMLTDVNFSNFIIGGDGVYAVDFEEAEEGRKERPVGEFAAFLLSYRPEFSKWKLEATEKYFQLYESRYGADRATPLSYMRDKLFSLAARRGGGNKDIESVVKMLSDKDKSLYTR